VGENDALDLQAHECAPDDVGRGRARIGREMRAKLGVEVGDVVDLRGSKGTVAVVARGLKRDSGKAVVRLDWATRRNAGVSLRESVRVAKASAVSAEEVELEPEDAKIYTLLTSVTEYERMREWLKGRALVLGDTVVLRREEDDLEEVALRVVDSKPAGALRIGDSTRLRLRSPPRRRIETPEQDRTGRVEVRRGRRDGTVVVA
jgi:transitional endoplasmic reticulum ATPase